MSFFFPSTILRQGTTSSPSSCRPFGCLHSLDSHVEVEAAFPQYLAELQGIADGAEVSFTDIFLLNLDDEISLLLESGDSETTVQHVTLVLKA